MVIGHPQKSFGLLGRRWLDYRLGYPRGFRSMDGVMRYKTIIHRVIERLAADIMDDTNGGRFHSTLKQSSIEPLYVEWGQTAQGFFP